MRILYINDELATNDGSNYHALGILNNLKKQLGADCVRSFPAPLDGSKRQVNHEALKRGEKYKLPLQLIRIVRKTILSRTRCRSICRALQAENWTPTHIITRTAIFDTTAIHVAKHFQAKLVYEVNAPLYYEQCIVNRLPFPAAVRNWERTILHKSDLIYTVSDTCRRMLLEQYDCRTKRFVVIPNGYMDELYTLSPRQQTLLRNQIRSREHFETKFVITFIGSLKKWHGISFLCKLAAYFESDSRFHFLVIGDGAEHNTIVQYCREHRNMTYAGKVDSVQMSHYLFASDLGIMPYEETSNFYFSPLKMFDMIGAGLPFIGTNQGQIHEIASLLGESFLIRTFSVEQIYSQIVSLAQDRECYCRMQQTLHQFKNQASWQHRAAQLLKALESLS